MAATITLHAWTGTGACTDGGSTAAFSFLSIDSALDTLAARLSNPIDIPSSGCAYSFEKWITACVSVAPTNNVSNFQVWGSPPAAAFDTGTCWLVGTAACGNGVAPVNTTSSVATSSLAAAGSGAKGAWDAASYAAAACETAFLVSQLQVVAAAGAGNWGGANGCVLNYSYQET